MIYTFLYLKLMQRIKALVPEVQHIDLYNSQPAVMDDGGEAPVNVPAVFIEFLPVDWTGSKIQQGDLVFNLYILTEATGTETDSTEQADVITSSLERLALKEKLFKALHGYQDSEAGTFTQFGKIQRTTSRIDSNTQQLATDVLTFKTRLWDDAAAPVYSTAEINLRIKGDIVEGLNGA